MAKKLYACIVCGSRFITENYNHANCLSCYSSVHLLDGKLSKKEVENLKAVGVPEF